MDTKFPYDDIVNLPHPTSKKHPRMSMEERAAQFSPFAALTGFGAVIQETGRLTGSRRGLTDSDIRRLEEQLKKRVPGFRQLLHGSIDATLAVHLGPHLLGAGIQFLPTTPPPV